MNLFQIIVVPMLAILAVLEVRAYLRNRQLVHGVRLLIWVTAGILILVPSVSSILATKLGIGRGTDLVFYGFTLVGTAFMFHLYGRQVRLRRDLITLTRHHAIETAFERDSPGDDAEVPG